MKVSKIVRVYKPAWEYYGKLAGKLSLDIPLRIRAVVGGQYGKSVAFEFELDVEGNKVRLGCVLSEAQVIDLIEVLLRRLRCAEGFCATDWGEYACVDGYGRAKVCGSD